MPRKVIKLSTQEDLKIFMSPQRQKLLRLMSIAGEPLTPKAIADLLGISPSSAQFHIKKLESLGIVELDHTAVINGINAKFYRMADANVSIGATMDDELQNERFVIMQNLLKNTLDGFVGLGQADIPKEEMKNYGDFLHGVMHLREKDAQELLDIIRNYVETHETKGEATNPWEYALILYSTDQSLKDND